MIRLINCALIGGVALVYAKLMFGNIDVMVFLREFVRNLPI